MIDPDNIKADEKITTDLPKIVTADDYHDFGSMQIIYESIGLNVVVEEVGFNEFNREYVALVHVGTPAHINMAKELRDYYENLSDELEEKDGYGM